MCEILTQLSKKIKINLTDISTELKESKESLDKKVFLLQNVTLIIFKHIMIPKTTPIQKKHVFVLLFLIPFLMGTGTDLYVPSLPAITAYFKISAHLTQFTIGLYMLGYAIGQFFLGILSDSLGRKKISIYSAPIPH